MSELIQRRREQFRVDIRKQGLEKEFSKKRLYDQHSWLDDIKDCENLYEFESKYKTQIEQQIDSILSNPCDENISKLIELIKSLSSQFSLYLIEKDVFETLKCGSLDLNLSLNLVCLLFGEPLIAKHVFANQMQIVKLTEFLNYISNNPFEEHRNLYWQLMLTLSRSSYTSFPFLKQIYLICCEELIQCRNNSSQQQVCILPTLISKYPQANQFFWDSLNKLDNEQRRPWKAAQHFLKQPNSDVYSCEQLILMTHYLLQYSRPSYYNQIVTPDLIHVLQSNFYRHERTLVRSLKCLEYIFEQDSKFAILVHEDLVKLLQITILDGQIEILKTLEIILRNEQQTKCLIQQFNIIQVLFDILKANILSTVNSISLQCIANALRNCTDIQLFYVVGNEAFKSTLDNYAYDQHKAVQRTAEFLLQQYFDK